MSSLFTWFTMVASDSTSAMASDITQCTLPTSWLTVFRCTKFRGQDTNPWGTMWVWNWNFIKSSACFIYPRHSIILVELSWLSRVIYIKKMKKNVLLWGNCWSWWFISGVMNEWEYHLFTHTHTYINVCFCLKNSYNLYSYTVIISIIRKARKCHILNLYNEQRIMSILALLVCDVCLC